MTTGLQIDVKFIKGQQLQKDATNGSQEQISFSPRWKSVMGKYNNYPGMFAAGDLASVIE